MTAAYLGIGAGAGLAAGFALCYLWFSRINRQAFRKTGEIVAEGQARADKIVEESRQEAARARDEAEKRIRDERAELRQFETRLQKKEDVLDRRVDGVQQKERQVEQKGKDVDRREKEIVDKEREVGRVVEEEKAVLHRISQLTKEDAVRLLMEKLEPELDREKSDLIRKSMEAAREGAEEEAKRIISMAIQRFASSHTADSVVTVVDIANDDMKGRIIGREGRNIRAFERATGVDVIVDDTPGVIVLSAFDGVRREMARRSMEKLLLDGRIHPTRIEEITDQTKREMEEHINNVGREFLREQDILNVHPKLVTLLGRLKYRTSYGQNVLQHVREVAHLSAVMAAELKLDPKLARRCGVFHDIGKAVDQEFEGSHPVIGGELLKRFDERKEVVDAAANHHNDADVNFLYTVLASAADAISASRPGARSESMDRYIKRIEALEALAESMPGVTGVYAIQAGREVRVIVDSDKITDPQAVILARDLAKAIELQLTYPGEIRVTVMRETRFVEYAQMKVRILGVGDIVGKPGRTIIRDRLAEFCHREMIDCVVANGENLAGGSGLMPDEADELFRSGVHVITGGDHIWAKKEIIPYIGRTPHLLRPANYPADQPGRGSTIVETAAGAKVGVLHLQGRVFMNVPCDCPFLAARRVIDELKVSTPIIVVDMHCEATSEKIGMGWWLDGNASFVFGTHTHIQTADERVLPKGTAYITDAGMCGPYESVIGRRVDRVLHRFTTGMPAHFEVATGDVRLCGAIATVDSETGRALDIKRVVLYPDGTSK